jgi:hypothetical protein
MNPDILTDEDAAVTHRRTIAVFAKVDYLVLVTELEQTDTQRKRRFPTTWEEWTELW